MDSFGTTLAEHWPDAPAAATRMRSSVTAGDGRPLVTAVAQDAGSGRVLMLAWMDPDALAETLRTGLATYYSRSRQERWVKGATSGNTQQVVSVEVDCDGDAVLLKVIPAGPACHTGLSSCFDTASLDVGAAAPGAAPADAVPRAMA